MVCVEGASEMRHTIRKQTKKKKNEKRVTGNTPSAHEIHLKEHVNGLVCGKYGAHVTNPD